MYQHCRDCYDQLYAYRLSCTRIVRRLTQTPLQQNNLRDPRNPRLNQCFRNLTSETAT
jgi:hypothetical protein